MTPWKPPPPVPRKRPFQLVSGSHASIWIWESDVGVSVAVTRQNAGRPVIGVEPGGVKEPPVMSVADVIVVSSKLRDCRLMHGVAIADVLAIATIILIERGEPPRPHTSRMTMYLPVIAVKTHRYFERIASFPRRGNRRSDVICSSCDTNVYTQTDLQAWPCVQNKNPGLSSGFVETRRYLKGA